MTSSVDKTSGINPLSTIALGLVLFLCVAMIGVTGYVKYRLDQKETALTAPDSTFTADQEVYEKTLRSLGYGGFLGAAQTFIVQHDKASLSEMKQNLKAARESFDRLSEKTPTAVRHDIRAILDTFSAALTRAEQSLDNLAAPFSLTDLLPSLAALPALDSRLQTAVAANKLALQGSFNGWSLGLMIIAWLGLILAACMAVCYYFSLHNRQAVPLHALMKSVENLSRGDMQNPIWGMERHDAIGELARAIDLARYHFSQLPDLSLLSEQGPIRLKFEGETRSLFQAMMRNVAEDFNQARDETAALVKDINAQRDLLSSFSSRIGEVIKALQEHGSDNDALLQRMTQNLTETAQNLVKFQENSTAHVNQLVPYMQERAKSMAEVTQIAGTQLAQTLQTLMQAERGIRETSEQSKKAIDQLSSSSNEMGERLFATVNLMQASNKVLTETTENVQSRFNEAVDTMGRGENKLHQIILRAESRLNSATNAEESMATLAARAEASVERMDTAARSMGERYESISEQVVLATHRMESIVMTFDAAQRSMSESLQQVRRDGAMLSNMLQDLRSNNEQLISSLSENSRTGHSAVQALTERSQALMQRLEVQIEQHAQVSESRIDLLASQSQAMAKQAQTAMSSLAQTVESIVREHDKLAATRTQFSESIQQIGSRLEQSANSSLGRTEKWAEQSYDKLSNLTGQVDDLMQRLNALGQLTGTLGAVAGQLGQLVPSLSKYPALAAAGSADSSGVLPESIIEEMHAQWNKAMVQIEAMHDQLAQMVIKQKDQLETRLIVMDKKIKSLPAETEADPQQMNLMSDIIATLAKINENIIQLDETVQNANLKKCSEQQISQPDQAADTQLASSGNDWRALEDSNF